MTLLFFDGGKRLVAQTGEALSLVVDEAALTCDMSVTPEAWAQADPNGYFGFTDVDGALTLYRILTSEEEAGGDAVTVYGECLGYELLTESYLTDVSLTGVTAAEALARALQDTEWEAGQTPPSAVRDVAWQDVPRLEALQGICQDWGLRYRFRVVASGNRIARQIVDLEAVTPVWRGKRYRLGKDVTAVRRNLDNRDLCTVLYGRGKGASSGDDKGARLTFADVAWSVADGDPCDKPLGQDYVEDEEAVARYGRLHSLVALNDIEDPEALLCATWEELQRRKQPNLAYEATVLDLERMGFDHEAARVGDECLLLVDEMGLAARATVSGIQRDYIDPAATTITFGELSPGLAKRVGESAATWDRAGALNPSGTVPGSVVTGALDIAKTRLQSVLTNFTTDNTGAFVWTSADGTSAMRITGAGLQIAKSKVGDDWQWEVAATGQGIVANAVTTGILSADRVRSGTLASLDGRVSINLDGGGISFRTNAFDINLLDAYGDTVLDMSAQGEAGFQQLRAQQAAVGSLSVGGKPLFQDNLTLYVNASSGSDGNTGQEDAPLRTVQAALDRLPRFIMGEVAIHIAPGSAYEGFYIKGFCGSGTLVLDNGDVADNAAVAGNVDVYSNNCAVMVHHLDAYRFQMHNNRAESYFYYCNGTSGSITSFDVYNCPQTLLLGCKCSGNVGIYAYYATLRIVNCTGSCRDTGLLVDHASIVAVNGTHPTDGNHENGVLCRNGGILLGEGTAGGDTPTPPPAPPAPTTRSFTASMATYRGGKWRTDAKGAWAVQGDWGGYGNNLGCFFFSGMADALRGKTILSATLDITRYNAGGYSDGRPLLLGGLNIGYKGEGTPSASDNQLVGTLARGERKVVNVPASVMAGISSGAYKGLSIYAKEGNLEGHYILIDTEPTLTVTYQ